MSQEGAVWGRYRLLRRIRDCQVGEAFLATRQGSDGFDKPVVLRCTGAETRDRVIEEANRAACLSHGGLAQVLDAGVLAGRCFVASEHVPGRALDSILLDPKPPPWRLVVRALSQAASALCYVHGRRRHDGTLLGMVHGRITPRRITLSFGGDATISGAGTSWAWPDSQGFGAPEETRGEPMDGRADVFSLGVILDRFLTKAAAPPELSEVAARATHALQEHRGTAAWLHDALEATLRG